MEYFYCSGVFPKTSAAHICNEDRKTKCFKEFYIRIFVIVLKYDTDSETGDFCSEQRLKLSKLNKLS